VWRQLPHERSRTALVRVAGGNGLSVQGPRSRRLLPRLPSLDQHRLTRLALRCPAVRHRSFQKFALRNRVFRIFRVTRRLKPHCSPAGGRGRCWPVRHSPLSADASWRTGPPIAFDETCPVWIGGGVRCGCSIGCFDGAERFAASPVRSDGVGNARTDVGGP
jgi:hypothetical protein